MPNILETKLRNKMRILYHIDLIERKIKACESGSPLNEIGVLEFHPSDICDLNCFYCTYRYSVKWGKPEDKMFPFDHLDRLVALKPKAIVIAGGGEPVLYRYQDQDFNDLIMFIVKNIPGVKIGLITNGMKVPPGEWINYVSWVRVSLDAATTRTFQALKDGRFEDRIASIIKYLQSPIEHVGIGFLYNRFNIHEIPNFIKLIYEIVINTLGDSYLKKLNMQFRPTCPQESCDCPSEIYRKSGILPTPDLHEWWHEELRNIERKIELLKNQDGMLKVFIENNTNLHEVLGKKREKVRIPVFKHCYVALVRWILRPNGDIYPCVMKASNMNAKIGNILKDPIEELNKKACKFYNLEKDWCDGPPSCCRVSGVLNEIVEKFFQGETFEIPDDPFF